MEKQKPRYRLDKKTGHLLEVPTKKQVRENVKKIREQKGKDQLPQSPVTIHETQAEKNFKRFRRSSTACTPRRNCPIFFPWLAISSSPPSVSSISRANSVAYFLIRKAASLCSAMARWLRSSLPMFAFSSRFRSPSSRNMKWHQVEK